MKDFLLDFLPFVGVGFATGFAIGVLVDYWALITLFP